MANKKKQNKTAVVREKAAFVPKDTEAEKQSQAVTKRAAEPLYRENVLGSRLGYAERTEETRFKRNACKGCATLVSRESGAEAILPDLYLSEVWKRAHTDETGKPRTPESPISSDDWNNATRKLAACLNVSKGDADKISLRTVWNFNELDYQELHLPQARAAAQLMQEAIAVEIKSCERLNNRWHKLRNYKHAVSLEEEQGGIFTKKDADILRSHGIFKLNDLKKHGVYELKNMHLSRFSETIVEDVNAAYREDLARRKDFRYRFWPLLFTFLTMLPVIVLCVIYRYTLLKERYVTLAIFAALLFWTFAVLGMLYGIIRAQRRRKKRRSYRFFNKRVRIAFLSFCVVSLLGIGMTSYFYERFDNYDDVFYYKNTEDGYVVAGIHTDDEVVSIPETVQLESFSGFQFLPDTDAGEHLDGDFFQDKFGVTYQMQTHKVVGIAPSGLRGGEFQKITIPENILSVGSKAFENCTQLLSVTLPDGIGELNDKTFANCAALESVSLPFGLSKVGDRAFADCTSLKKIALPETVLSLGDEVFCDCTSLETLQIGDNVERIGEGLIEGCSALTSLKIPFLGETVEETETCAYLTGGDESYLKSIELTTAPRVIKDTLETCPDVQTVTLGSATELDAGAFQQAKKLKTVRLAKGSTSLGESIFEGCNQLSNLVSGTLLSSVGKRAFYGCESLKDGGALSFESLKYVGEEAFYGCRSLTSVNLFSATHVGDSAFKSCVSLKTVALFSALDDLGTSVFEKCISLTGYDVTIPSPIRKIPDGTFRGCTSLQTLPQGNWTEAGIAAFQDCTGLRQAVCPALTVLGESAFENCTSLYSVEAPLTELGARCFQNCRELCVLSGQEQIEIIGEQAFSGCLSMNSFHTGPKITKITQGMFANGGFSYVYLDSAVTEIGESAFANSKLQELELSSSRVTLGAQAFGGCTNLTAVRNLKTEEIPAHCFENCTALTSFAIASPVATVGDGAFYGCTSLKNLTFGNTVRTIGSEAFSGCTALQALTVPDTVTKIGKNAFGGLNLQTAYLPFLGYSKAEKDSEISDLFGEGSVSSLTVGYLPVIGRNMFDSMQYKLQSLTVREGLEEIERWAFYEFALQEISLPAGLKEIGKEAFRGSALTSVVLPDTVTELGVAVFRECKDLTSAVLSENLKEIPEDAFYASRLNTLNDADGIVVPDWVTEIGEYAFYKTHAKRVTVGSGVVEIGKYAFARCPELKEVRLGGAVEELGKCAFAECSRLTDFQFNQTLKTLNAESFRECTSLTEIEVPMSVTVIGKNVFESCSSLKTLSVPFLGWKPWYGDSVSYLTDSAALTTVKVTAADKIGSEAFSGFENLKTVVISDGVETFDEEAFVGCSAKQIFMPEAYVKTLVYLPQGCTVNGTYHAGGQISK